MKMKLSLTTFATIGVCAAACMLQACAPVKGYTGPELPDSEVAAIFPHYDSNVVTINQAGIEGVPFGGQGIHVLPGEHPFDIQVTIKDPPHHCRAYPKMNHYGYSECLKKHDDDKCDCYDYLEVYKHCFREVRDGVCSGRFKADRGRQYDIHAAKKGARASAAVFVRGTTNRVAEGECNMGEWRTEEEDTYEGSGEYEARSHGIYGCY